MAFSDILDKAVKRFNEKYIFLPEIREVFNKYRGRSITLNITDDTIYIFHFKDEGIVLETSPQNPLKDIYIETRKEVFQRIIEERKVRVQDVLQGKISWKNISLRDIRSIGRLLKLKHLNIERV
ncbi:MAG: hypothetical protein N3E48_00175 [Candidatus Bathyarchaeota archaeon]|nr:hypothetical protein [Candidatus Bathyarchaeota archaeon]